MRYVTFNQALLAVGLVGLVLALTNGEGNSFGIAASLLVEDGPSIGGPVILLAVSLALPLGILAIALARVAAIAAADEAGKPLTYAEARLLIGLAGLILLATIAPQLLTANANAGWDESVDSFVFLGIALVILAAILGSALGGRHQDSGVFGLPQVLRCVALIALVIAAALAPAVNGVLVAGSTDAPDLISRGSPVALHSYKIVAVGVVLVILLGVRVKSGMGLRSVIVTGVILAGIAASVHLFYTLTVGLPLAALVGVSYLGSRNESSAGEPLRTGPLLTLFSLLSLTISASTIQYVISLYHACAKFDTSLYLWPTLALLAAIGFSFGVLGVGLRKWRGEAGGTDGSGDTQTPA